jgi:hypothetical protein
MKFRGRGRVIVRLRGEDWIVPASYKMFMRRVRGIIRYRHDFYESLSAGFIDTWFIEKGYTIGDISFVEGSKEYSPAEYSKRTGIPIEEALQRQWEAVKVIADRNAEREKEKKRKPSPLELLFA